ncbi:MAG: RNase adapter RapZ [Rhodoferax sp.]|nr:RNase adapter RapZ [Rhodoferax sp.]
MEMVLITGMSGSGKSVALHALEDAGFYCVDNLPPELLLPFVELEKQHHATQLAIAMDVRSATSLPQVPQQLQALRARGIVVKPLFLDAATGTLVRRYSETRRRHPLSQSEVRGAACDPVDGKERRALVEAIELERSLLGELREQAHVIDTSMIRPAQLQGYVKSLVTAGAAQLTLVFESFAFKRGVPSDADFMFDVRMLPNPHYAPALKNLTGRDQPVIDYLEAQDSVLRMRQEISAFLDGWLPELVRDNRSYVTVAIGCTGGQHRSVYLVEKLAKVFAKHGATLIRHRELGSTLEAATPQVGSGQKH